MSSWQVEVEDESTSQERVIDKEVQITLCFVQVSAVFGLFRVGVVLIIEFRRKSRPNTATHQVTC